MSEVLEIENDGHLRVLRLNRPERKNALTGPLIEAIVAGLRDAAHDDDVWAVAITGNGDAFCSGLDLAGMDGDRDDDGDDERRRQQHPPAHVVAGESERSRAVAYRVARRRSSRASGHSVIREPMTKTKPASQIRFTSGFTSTLK